jgi:MCP family monocarboxylic acid transporter-like MFS transporter 10
MLGCMTIALTLMRTRLPPRSKLPAGNAPPVPHIRELVKDTKYMITTLASFFNVIGIFVPSTYHCRLNSVIWIKSDIRLVFFMQTFAVVHGVDQNLAFYTLTILNGASVVSSEST